MAQSAITYTSSVKPIDGKAFVCKRCKREYPQLKPGERPIRCECGWWYYNDGSRVLDAFWQRLEPYRMPPAFAKLFKEEF